MLLYQKYQSGDGVIRNNAQSIHYLKQAVANKHPEALVELAKLYETESNSEITYDIKAAFDLYYDAAELDNAKAQYNLARFYEQGLAVAKNEEELFIGCVERSKKIIKMLTTASVLLTI